MAQTAPTLEVLQQVSEDPSPSAVVAPASEAAVDGFPGPIALGDVAPGGASVEAPEDPIEDALMILPGSATTVLVGRVREEWGDTLPLPLREFMATRHGWSPGRTSTLRKGRSWLI